MIEDGDLFFENTGTLTRNEDQIATMSDAQKRWKLTKIKEVYRLYRSCFLGKARDKWILATEKAPEFTVDPADNYEADNKLSVSGFFEQQKDMVRRLFEE